MADVERLVKETIKHFGGLDVLIGNAVCTVSATLLSNIFVISNIHNFLSRFADKPCIWLPTWTTSPQRPD